LKDIHRILFLEGVSQAPVKTENDGNFLECIVGIGNDHTLRITMHQDDFDKLNELIYG